MRVYHVDTKKAEKMLLNDSKPGDFYVDITTRGVYEAAGAPGSLSWEFLFFAKPETQSDGELLMEIVEFKRKQPKP